VKQQKKKVKSSYNRYHLLATKPNFAIRIYKENGSGANMNSYVNMDKKCSGKYEDHKNEIIRIIQMEAL
jgi:hypothetical protein